MIKLIEPTVVVDKDDSVYIEKYTIQHVEQEDF